VKQESPVRVIRILQKPTHRLPRCAARAKGKSTIEYWVVSYGPIDVEQIQHSFFTGARNEIGVVILNEVKDLLLTIFSEDRRAEIHTHTRELRCALPGF
jgi:hypothetical protein